MRVSGFCLSSRLIAYSEDSAKYYKFMSHEVIGNRHYQAQTGLFCSAIKMIFQTRDMQYTLSLVSKKKKKRE